MSKQHKQRHAYGREQAPYGGSAAAPASYPGAAPQYPGMSQAAPGAGSLPPGYGGMPGYGSGEGYGAAQGPRAAGVEGEQGGSHGGYSRSMEHGQNTAHSHYEGHGHDAGSGYGAGYSGGASHGSTHGGYGLGGLPGAGLDSGWLQGMPAFLRTRHTEQFLLGAVIGAAATWVLTDEQLRGRIVKSAMKLYAGVAGGVEEVKEQMADIRAEVEAERQGDV